MAEILPAIFFGHGNPMNAVLDNNYTKAWSRIGQTTPKPKAILSISAHWFVSETVDAGSEQELRNHVLAILRCVCRS
jgi:aromatic ring-opening dioxygenase catalytic subunit (LigB family)